MEEIIEKARKAHELYHRLVLVIAPSGSGKTSVLNKVCEDQGWPSLNVNLELSKRMLELTARQRSLHASVILGELARSPEKPVVLDNIELLFDRSLQLDPLRVLTELSRNQTVVASCNGEIGERGLTYAVPNHPEYRHYTPAEIDFLHVAINGKEP